MMMTILLQATTEATTTGMSPFVWVTIIVAVAVGIAKIAQIFKTEIYNMFKKVPKRNLYKHKIYLEKSYIEHKINTLDVGESKKNEVFKRLLLLKYDTILSKSSELIEKCKDNDYDGDDFYRMMLKNMTNIIDAYNVSIKDAFNDEIYDLIMDHPEKGFNKVHEKTIVFIKGIAKETFNGDHMLYKTTEDKLDFLLDLYYIAMKIAMSDVAKIYNSFNGDLTKLMKKCKKI